MQAGDLRAPPILINSSISAYEGYTDNPRYTPQTFSDSLSRLEGATNLSFDTVRFQGQISSNTEYDKYARASDQDVLNENLLAFGLGTIVPEHLFVDARGAITQLSRAGGVGVASSSNIPPAEQTQALTTSLSPVYRTSFGDLADAELRYTFGLNLFNNGSLLNNAAPTPTTPSSSSLSNSEQNEVTLTLATGRAFSTFGSKLTIDAQRIDSQSAARSSQLRAYDDFEYGINPYLAALGRLGYEDIQYPLQPAATTQGLIWLVGGRFNPAPGDYLVLRYGLQNGFYSPDALLRYQVTARTTLLASYGSGLSSAQGALLGNLDTSQLSANGTIVNQYTGLPSALSNPEFAYLSNDVYRTKNAQIGLQTALDRDTFALTGNYTENTQLGFPTTATGTTGVGNQNTLSVTGNWSRSITPWLTSTATLGYGKGISIDQTTLSADMDLTYNLNDNLSGIIHYQWVNVVSKGTAASDFTGFSTNNYTRNLIEIGLKRSF